MKALKLVGSVLAVVLLVLVNSCAFSNGGERTMLNGNLRYSQEELQAKPFTEIDIETVADVYYTQNNSDKQEVRLDFSAMTDSKLKEQFKEKAKVVYRDGKVIIGLNSSVKGSSGIKKNARLRVYITSPDLVKVTMEGVGSFNSDAINSDVFEVDNEGVGNVNIKKLLSNKIEITNEGVGSVNLGDVQSDRMSVDNEGVGGIYINQFKGGVLDIDNEGVGKVEACVDCQKVSATLEGVGSIKLSGVTRKFNKTKEGVGSFKTSDLKVLE